MPFFIFPVALIAVAGLPAGYLFKKVLQISPFAICIAIANPFLDRHVIFNLGPVGIWGGWVSFLSVLVRFFLTVTAALVLIATTGFNAVCMALSKLGVPKPFVVQLMFLYRYIFVLIEETERLTRARTLRSCTSRAMGISTFASLVGNLLLRTMDRAERIYLAMCCSGFDGRIRVIRSMKRGLPEFLFVIGWGLLFIVLRFSNIPFSIGAYITGRSS